MPLGWAAYESGSQMGYMYFPTTTIVSLLYVLENGASAEIAIIGNCGLFGISLFMAGESTRSRAVVQSAGNAYRLKASVLKKEFARGGPLRYFALRSLRRSSRRWRKPRFATGTMRWTSNYAAGCC